VRSAPRSRSRRRRLWFGGAFYRFYLCFCPLWGLGGQFCVNRCTMRPVTACTWPCNHGFIGSCFGFTGSCFGFTGMSYELCPMACPMSHGNVLCPVAHYVAHGWKFSSGAMLTNSRVDRLTGDVSLILSKRIIRITIAWLERRFRNSCASRVAPQGSMIRVPENGPDECLER